MNNQYQRSKNIKTIVFSQWSRKDYSIFASLNKVVKIVRLSIDVFKSLKDKIVGSLLNKDITQQKYVTDTEQDEILFPDWVKILISFLFFEVIAIKTTEQYKYLNKLKTH